VSRGLAVGDLFNDGNLDVVIGDLDGAPMLLRNRGVLGQHWVRLEVFGTKSNRLAIGAKLKLTAGGVTQTSSVQSGGSYLSQNDMRVHFGLGTATKIESLEITWPSGEKTVLRDLAADKGYAIEEGAGVVPAEKTVRPADKR